MITSSQPRWSRPLAVPGMPIGSPGMESGRPAGARPARLDAVPRTVWYAVLADPEGNVFAIWQPDATAFPPPEPD